MRRSRALSYGYHYGFVGVLSGLLLAIASVHSDAAGALKGPAEGAQAPAIRLQSLSGKTVSLASLRGDVVIVDFWATWCPDCRESLPHLQKLSADPELAKRGLKVLAVDAHEDRHAVENYIKANKYTFTVLLDHSVVQREYGVDSLPRTFIIGRDGKIRKIFFGVEKDTMKQIDAAVNEALASPSRRAKP